MKKRVQQGSLKLMHSEWTSGEMLDLIFYLLILGFFS